MRDPRTIRAVPARRHAAHRSVLALALLGGLAVAAVPASAPAQESGAAPAPKPAPAAAQLDEATLDAFARASLEVDALGRKWRPKIAAAETQAQQEDLRQQALDEMAQAVQDEGMTIAAYNDIVEASRADAELAGRIEERRQSLQ